MADTMRLCWSLIVVVICLSRQTHGDNYRVSRQTESGCLSFDELLKKDINKKSPLKVIIDGRVELHFPLQLSSQSKLTLLGRNKGTISCFNHSGISFHDVKDLTINNIIFEHCGLLGNSTSTNATNSHLPDNATNLQYPTAIYIERCSNISITKSVFENNYGVGVSIYDPINNVDILDCNFTANSVLADEEDVFPGGGGLRIELTSCPPGVYSKSRTTCDMSNHTNATVSLSIAWCTFDNNTSTALNDSTGYFEIVHRFGRGGGLIFIAEDSGRFNLHISHCTFRNNLAEWGGGMLILITGFSFQGNRVEVSNSVFVNNRGRRGGGGAYIQLSHEVPLTDTVIKIKHCQFAKNSANIGGAVTILTSEVLNSSNNIVLFSHCNWTFNSANFSAAIDLSRIIRASYTSEALIPKFICCRFANNYVTNSTETIGNSSANRTAVGKGTVMALYFTIVFEVRIDFVNNTGSALYLLSSKASFSTGITATFSQNRGINGGAFCLRASSVININSNSMIVFANNRAHSLGGAIYYNSIGEHELHDRTQTCIFDNESNVENLQINFTANTQYNGQNSIFYASPLSGCIDSRSNGSVIGYLKLPGDFNFDTNSPLQIQGPGIHISVNDSASGLLKVFPGIKFNLPFQLTDENNNDQSDTFIAEIIHGHDIIAIDKDYVYSTGKQIILFGESGSKGKILFRTTHHRIYEFTFDVELLTCPPGLYMGEDNNRRMRCLCYNQEKGSNFYHTIRCGPKGQKALIVFGYWAGYMNDSTTGHGPKPTGPDTFYTATCPPGFCQYYETDNHNNSEPLYQLPSSTDAISSFMCGSTRTGVLCGECTSGNSVFYHSPTLKCKEDKLCKLGWLFYILSELIPLTAFFVVIILFNIKFTSGIISGFVFYCQVVTTLAINSYGVTGKNLSKVLDILTDIYLFIYRCFNMEFFKHDSLSFCLWSGATTLDVMALTYITIIYAFVMIVLTIVIMNYCSCCSKVSHKQQTSKSYAIHGLSTFLIMCYVRCTKVSFQILASSKPAGAMQMYAKRRRVFYSGNYQYFDEHHVVYAIPALVCIVIIVIIPPAILLWYPMGPKLLQKCGLGESRAVKILNKLIPVHKLQPFLDSFQSCYKDECRFFSGLNFLYRTIILAAFAWSVGVDQFYTSVQILLIAMLLLQAIAQPYKNKWHNICDALILATLSAINVFSVYIVSQQAYLDTIAKRNILQASIFQIFLVYLPLLSLLTCGVFKVITVARDKLKKNSTAGEELLDFPARLIDSDDDSSDESESRGLPKSPYVKNE